ncbi:LpqB family beta-propeller domain-containing protein [Streptomyces sp. JV178]|uniref:LpqB family beta-propeller domain-containing protein n=1 Tax=Streptomyces sp. JV178 TaxID=858632 RepID=UPI0015D5603E|nr:LpqB family beta-propeller domain-containing protein [Streptomyces sp. JV178]
MGADRAKRGRGRPVRATAYVGIGAVLLAGCASMPDSGDMRDVESTPRQDTQVRVFALPPAEDAQPQEIVQGFLEALTSDDPNYETARKYLTGGALKTWDPGMSTTVLVEAPTPFTKVTGSESDSTSYRYELSGEKVARVDGQHAYTPASGEYEETVHLTKVKVKDTEQWRIDKLPQGVILGRSDFERNYKSINKYYFTSAAQSGEAGRVADPVYVRSQVDPVTQIVRDLLNGPTRWLNWVARTSFPSGTALRKGTADLTPDEQNRLVVPLNAKADRVSASRCQEMAEQLLFTLQDYMPNGIDEVELQGSTGAQLCAFGEDQPDTDAANRTGKGIEYEYFIDGEHRLVRLSAGESTPTPVPGDLGEGVKQLRSAAVSRDQERAAGVSADGRELYVAPLTSGGAIDEPVLRSAGATAKDRLTTPSWDGRGDLWVADRDPKKPRLLVLADGKGEPLEVRTAGLDGRIEAVRVAADGVRAALIMEKDGKRSLFIGRVERDADADGTTVSIVDPRSVTPDLEDVSAMSWAGGSRLVVVGRESGGVQQTRYVQVDGSTLPGPTPSALTGVEEIAASENESQPLVAHSADGIVRLAPGEQWQTVVKEGSAPVYPG